MNRRIQQFLAAENITQAQLADTLGVARASISHIISGRNKPGFDFIESICLHYPKLNLEWLISGKGKMYKEITSIEHTQQSANNILPFNYSDTSAEEYDDDLPEDDLPEDDLPEAFPNSRTAPQENRDSQVPSSRTEQAPSRSLTSTKTKVESHKNSVNQRNITKVIIFFDDNSYQELK